MLYRKIPKTGDSLSILGFGCMRLPTDEKGSIDKKRAIEQIRYAIDNGVNYLDTAWPYHSGNSELLVADALGQGYREKVRLATKLPSWMIKSRDDMDYYLNAQLEKLKTGHIDYYLIHNLAGPIWEKLKSFGVLEFIDRAKQSGRIVNAGFSFHGKIDDFKTIVDDYPWEMCQIQYNYLDEELQAGTEGLEYAASKNLGIVIMEPLRGGNLGIPEPPPDVDAIWKEAPHLRTPVEWALRWIWNRPEVTVVLSGMNEEAHIKENLAIADDGYPDSLTEEELKLVNRVTNRYRKLMKVGCTGCEYCKPCPSGVNISGCFEILNKFHLFKNEDEAKFMYAIRMAGAITGTEPAFASQCTQCGECLEKCPQGIAIPDFLEEVAAAFEDENFEQRIAMGKKMLKIE
ncbi:Aldo/keto reductase [Desulfamplus magnetovallimortis]|uniref:Aldo/keto reductase n=1 Tax=Desulfamplus magnetovallimortis TaxID=1246637 RepID=A0A1W1H7J5_9BACT|nr:aldo/keto reductase [Desulfamplus magnetovallimortis]SLM28406.1 Aldo/keto reductase [Desulfamplus magnetovallimortis]